MLFRSQEALRVFSGGMQIGGGMNSENALNFIKKGASHVIITSYVFDGDDILWEHIAKLKSAVGKEHIVFAARRILQNRRDDRRVDGQGTDGAAAATVGIPLQVGSTAPADHGRRRTVQLPAGAFHLFDGAFHVGRHVLAAQERDGRHVLQRDVQGHRFQRRRYSSSRQRDRKSVV